MELPTLSAKVYYVYYNKAWSHDHRRKYKDVMLTSVSCQLEY